jgi:anti-sigma regulatory factor (Ser/Thr protein kinase)
VYHAEFPARHDAFHRVRTFVEEACEQAGIQRTDCLRLTLVVEELFVNTVVHGHGGDTDAPIRLGLTVTPAAIAVRYEDTARPFDPLAVSDEADDENDLDQRTIGGLGVRLIRAIAQDLHYASRDGWNQLTFWLARSSGG